MAATVAEIEAVLTARDEMSRVIRDVSRTTAKETSAMGKAWDGLRRGIGVAVKGAAVAMGGLAVGLGFAAKSAVDMNSTLETSTLQFETLMGDADRAKAHVEGLFDFAARTPFETEPIIQASRMLRTFGGDALDTEETLLRVGDAAAATSAPIEEVGTWVGRAYSAIQSGRPFGEAAQRLQELAILSPEARAQMEELQAAGADASEVWAVMEGDLDRFGGAMERQAGTWAGITSTIRDNISMLNATAFAPLFEALKELGGGLATWLQSDSAVGFAETVAEHVGGLVDKLKGWADWIKDEFSSRVDEGMSPLAAIRDIAGEAGGNLADMLPPGLSDAVKGLGAAFAIMAGPTGLIVRELLPALAPVLAAVAQPLGELAGDLAPALADILSEIADAVIPVLVPLLEGLADILGEHPEIVLAVVAAMAAFKAVAMGQMVAGAIPALIGAWGKLKLAFMANPWGWIIAAVAAIAVLIYENWDSIVSFLSGVWETITDAAETAWNWLKDTFAGILDTIVGFVMDWTIVGQIARHWDDIVAGVVAVKDWIVDKWNEVVSFLSGLPARVGRAISNLWGDAKSAVTGVKNWITDKWDEVVGFVTELPGRIASAASGMWNGIKNAFKDAINWIIRKWNNFSIGFSLPEILGGGDIRISTPNIPLFHEGGVFAPPAGRREGLAILERGETVIPAGETPGGVTVTQHITMPQADPERVMAAAAWRLRTAGV